VCQGHANANPQADSDVDTYPHHDANSDGGTNADIYRYTRGNAYSYAQADRCTHGDA
jgi:hypothetical protein